MRTFKRKTIVVNGVPLRVSQLQRRWRIRLILSLLSLVSFVLVLVSFGLVVRQLLEFE